MMDSPKAEQAELVRQLRSRPDSQEFQWLLKLTASLLESAKNELLEAQPEKLSLLQGKAQAYKELTRLLTRPDIAPNGTQGLVWPPKTP